jgi:hypothetical protein
MIFLAIQGFNCHVDINNGIVNIRHDFLIEAYPADISADLSHQILAHLLGQLLGHLRKLMQKVHFNGLDILVTFLVPVNIFEVLLTALSPDLFLYFGKVLLTFLLSHHVTSSELL